jgi:putative peptide zinc metalloprotease protein
MSAASPTLRARRRGDLEIAAQSYERQRVWSVKDPLALRYYHFTDEELWIWERLDGRRSLGEIQAEFERRFVPRRLSPAMLRGFVEQLHQAGLIVVDAPGQGEAFYRRRQSTLRTERLGWWTKLFSLRFRGVDPEPLLQRVVPLVRPFCSAPAAVIYVLLFVAAVRIVVTHTAEVAAAWTSVTQFPGPELLLWMVVVLGATRLVHELGHAVVCKLCGGECHEIGFMLFLFAPTVYCDVSDAWTFSSKWARMAVSAAGIGVELIVASVAILLWHFSEPGTFHDVCFLTAVLCSVNTLLLNGNPLLRYDGYHVMADYVEMPGLAQRAADVWRRFAVRWWFGERAAAEVGDPATATSSWTKELVLAAYALAAKLYSLFILFEALWFLQQWARGLGIQPITSVVATAALFGIVGLPLVGIVRRLRDPRRDHERYRVRFWTVTAVVGAIVVGVSLIPWPRSIEAFADLQPAAADTVYVTQPGRLVRVTSAKRVQAGDELAQLADDDLERELIKLSTERERLATVLQNLERRQLAPGSESFDLPTARGNLRDVEQRLAQRREDARRLTLRAPCSGRVLPPAERPARRDDDRSLPTWSGSPFDAENAGAYLQAGTPFCLVGDAERIEAMAVVDQHDVLIVRPVAEATVLVDVGSNRRVTGKVIEVGKSAVAVGESTPRDDAAAAGPQSATSPPVDRTAYQVRIALDERLSDSTFDLPVRVRIVAPAESLAAKARRVLSKTFRFE